MQQGGHASGAFEICHALPSLPQPLFEESVRFHSQLKGAWLIGVMLNSPSHLRQRQLHLSMQWADANLQSHGLAPSKVQGPLLTSSTVMLDLQVCIAAGAAERR